MSLEPEDKFSLLVLHPRIQCTHSDTDRVYNHTFFYVVLSYKMSRHERASNVFFLYVKLHYLASSPKPR